jgi:uncharacterized protein
MIDVVVWFFVLGVIAKFGKSDLRLPDAIYEALSIYLLLAIGLKGGAELSRQPVAELAPLVLALMALGFAIPFALYPALRALRFDIANSASLGAHFGSVSVVTFAVATAELARRGIATETHAPLWVAVMEAPGLIAGALLARMFLRDAGDAPLRWPPLLHDLLFGKSVLLLLGGLTIGALAGEAGISPIKVVFVDPFKGVLAIFLLELGLVAGGRIAALRSNATRLLATGLVIAPVLGICGVLLGWALGLSVGGTAVVGTLAASASYIAAPAAMRQAVPAADPAISITVALGVVFPFNILAGIPLYIWLAQQVHGS